LHPITAQNTKLNATSYSKTVQKITPDALFVKKLNPTPLLLSKFIKALARVGSYSPVPVNHWFFVMNFSFEISVRDEGTVVLSDPEAVLNFSNTVQVQLQSKYLIVM